MNITLHNMLSMRGEKNVTAVLFAVKFHAMALWLAVFVIIRVNATKKNNFYSESDMSELICEKHKVSLECLGGASAHPDNWYCPICDELTRLQAENERQQEKIGRLRDALEAAKAKLIEYADEDFIASGFGAGVYADPYGFIKSTLNKIAKALQNTDSVPDKES